MHADKYEDIMVIRDLADLLFRVGLIEAQEFADIVRILVGRIVGLPGKEECGRGVV